MGTKFLWLTTSLLAFFFTDLCAQGVKGPLQNRINLFPPPKLNFPQSIGGPRLSQPRKLIKKKTITNPTVSRQRELTKTVIVDKTHVQTGAQGTHAGNTAFTSCEIAWKGFGNNCYKAIFDKSTFAEAQVKCKAKGAHLVSLHGSKESSFVKSEVITKKPKKSYWIGLTHRKDGFHWTDGSPFDYNKIAPGPRMKTLAPEREKTDPDRILAPNKKDFKFLEDCWKLDGLDQSWNPLNCTAGLFFVCEKVAGTQPVTEIHTPTTTPASTTAGSSGETTPAPTQIPGHKVQLLGDDVGDLPRYLLNGILPLGAAMTHKGNTEDPLLTAMHENKAMLAPDTEVATERDREEESMEASSSVGGVTEKRKAKSNSVPNTTAVVVGVVGSVGVMAIVLALVTWRLHMGNSPMAWARLQNLRDRVTRDEAIPLNVYGRL